MNTQLNLLEGEASSARIAFFILKNKILDLFFLSMFFVSLNTNFKAEIKKGKNFSFHQNQTFKFTHIHNYIG